MPEMNGGGSAYGLDDHIYQRLLRERIIFLGSEVRDQNANAICAQMLLLSAEDPEADIFLHINSPGGSVDSGMAIYDTMNYIPNDVATVGMGLAASMGQFLLCAGLAGQALRAAARADHDAPAVGRHGRLRVRHQDPGPAVPAHQAPVLFELISEHTGQPLEQVETRRRPRPLVHRGAGAGTTASSTTWSAGPPRPPTRAARPAPSEADMTRHLDPTSQLEHELLHPAVGGAHLLRLPADRPLRQALRGAHHLPRHPDQRRRRQRGHGPAAVPGVRWTRTGTSASTSTRRVARSPR